VLERYDILLRLTLLRRFQSPKHLIFWNVTAGIDDCSRVEQSQAQYRKFADECRRLAKFAQTADERKVLQEMAAAWTKVAEEVDGEAGKNGI
jgi:hypothetical protein